MGLLLKRRFRDLRRSPRHEVQYLAHVDPGSAGAPFNCIICDISASGAKLTVSNHHQVPDEFTLIFRRRCRTVHRTDGQVGVQFVQGP
jgi:PilZ domain